jgi:uncharacterized protein (DUF302 family)
LQEVAAMKSILFAMLWLFAFSSVDAVAYNGIVTLQSHHGVAATIDRLAIMAESKGLKVFIRIDHAAEAKSAGLVMRPAQLLIFGNPKGGTPLMNDKPTAALDLPLKALAWEDADGKTWVSYNQPAWLIERHGLNQDFLKNVSGVAALVDAAIK